MCNTYADVNCRMSKVQKFRELTEQMAETYAKKNADYGDSFGVSIRKYGPIAGLTRISDKFNRLENLLLNKGQQVSDESVSDTLMDLANYSIMLKMELETSEPSSEKSKPIAVDSELVWDSENANEASNPYIKFA